MSRLPLGGFLKLAQKIRDDAVAWRETATTLRDPLSRETLLGDYGEDDYVDASMPDDPVRAPRARDLDECRPIIGNCSKCGDVREDEYTCRDGGYTVLKRQSE